MTRELLPLVGPGAPPDDAPPWLGQPAPELGPGAVLFRAPAEGRLGAEAEDAATCFICEGHQSMRGVGGFLGPPDAPGAPGRISGLDTDDVAHPAVSVILARIASQAAALRQSAESDHMPPGGSVARELYRARKISGAYALEQLDRWVRREFNV